jgi:hypothetical protein
MNPLSIPFGNPEKPKVEYRAPIPHFLGVRNEVARDSASAQLKIKIQVSGVKGQPNATYEVEYMAGAPLKQYLDRLKLKQAACLSAVRDLSNMSAGRLRLHYVPTEKSHITLGNPAVSSVLQYQRSRVDAMAVARQMDHGAQVVSRRLK